MVNTPTITLKPSGQKLPQVGFGLWKVTNETCADTVYYAIEVGYRHFDGACDYGNEKEAGEGVRRAITDGLVKREDLFITSKLWNTFHKKSHVKPIAQKQLADWGLDYFDLFLMHFPVALEYVDPAVRYPSGWAYDGKEDFRPVNVPIQETWQAMEELVDEGLAKNIGVSNFQGSLLLDLLRCARIRPANLQIEHHPYFVQQSLLNLCKHEDIPITAYSPFGPASFVELNWKKACATPLLFENPTITSIAHKHGKTPAQVLLRWSTQRGLAVIPKSNNRQRLVANLSTTDFDLPEEDIKAISALDRGLRFNDPAEIYVAFSIFA